MVKAERVGQSLASVDAGNRVRIVSIEAGRGLRVRLASMGLLPGVAVEVVHRGHHGPLVISIGPNRLTLGRGIAYAILVE